MTIMGQSSGGTSVLALVSSPLSLDLFQGAISLSGSPNITMDLRTAQTQNGPLVSRLNCSAAEGYPTPSSRLACLRALSTQTLATSIPPSWSIPGMNGLPLSPHGQGYAGLVVVDGVLLPLPVQEALKEGVIDVPLLLGNMAQEIDPWPANEVEALSTPEWQLFLRRWYVRRGNEGGRKEGFWGMRSFCTSVRRFDISTKSSDFQSLLTHSFLLVPPSFHAGFETGISLLTTRWLRASSTFTATSLPATLNWRTTPLSLISPSRVEASRWRAPRPWRKGGRAPCMCT